MSVILSGHDHSVGGGLTIMHPAGAPPGRFTAAAFHHHLR
jgi:hypothetical protein